MKQVTIENVKKRIARIENAESVMLPSGMGLSMQHEFELACLRQLVAVTEQLHAVEAENAALKSSIDDIETKYMNWEGLSDAFDAAKALGTNITDAAIAALRAEGVEMFAKHCSEKSKHAISSDTRDNWWLCGEHADDFAAQLRQSVQVKGVQS